MLPAIPSAPNVIQYTVEARRRYLGFLIKCAETTQYLEDPLYALMGTIFSSLTDTQTPDGHSTLICCPQIRLVNHQSALVESIRKTKNAIPDFGLLRIEWPIDGSAIGMPGVMKKVVVLMLEAKRLVYATDSETTKNIGGGPVERNPEFASATPQRAGFLKWSTLEATVISDEKFISSLHQLLVQAYCTFTSYNQDNFYSIFVCGIYFTLVEFKRPPSLQHRNVSGANSDDAPPPAKFDLDSMKQCFFEDTTTAPEIIYYNESIFDLHNVAYEQGHPIFSDAWLLALKLALRTDIDTVENDLFPFSTATVTPVYLDRAKAANHQLIQWRDEGNKYSESTPSPPRGGPGPQQSIYYETPPKDERTRKYILEPVESPEYQPSRPIDDPMEMGWGLGGRPKRKRSNKH
ncbi:hypothetical protein BD779DRAFT_1569972 [Infundibulicybe gibba]|nr:hypothetical protein BD779DRAFT_1569972 [Infundibulicybe gibba]